MPSGHLCGKHSIIEWTKWYLERSGSRTEWTLVQKRHGSRPQQHGYTGVHLTDFLFAGPIYPHCRGPIFLNSRGQRWVAPQMWQKRDRQPPGGRVITQDPLRHRGGSDSSLEQTHTDLPSLPVMLLPAPLSVTHRTVNSLSRSPAPCCDWWRNSFYSQRSLAMDLYPWNSLVLPRYHITWWNGRMTDFLPLDQMVYKTALGPDPFLMLWFLQRPRLQCNK